MYRPERENLTSEMLDIISEKKLRLAGSSASSNTKFKEKAERKKKKININANHTSTLQSDTKENITSAPKSTKSILVKYFTAIKLTRYPFHVVRLTGLLKTVSHIYLRPDLAVNIRDYFK